MPTITSSRYAAKTLAAHAGIHADRLRRFLAGGGRVLPHEFAAVLHAAGTSARLSKTATVLAWLEDLGNCDPCLPWVGERVPPSIEITESTLLIDRLALSFDVVDRSTFQALLGAVGRRTAGTTSYEHSYRVRKSLVEFGSYAEDIHWARLETNPARLCSPDGLAELEVIRRVLDLANHELLNVTRLDVSVDLPLSIRDAQALDTSLRSRHLCFDEESFTGVYSGSKHSRREVVCYDKVRERIRKRRRPPPGPLTRIEVRLRDLGVRPGDLPGLANPFDGVRLFLLQDAGLAAGDRALLRCARRCGLPLLRLALTRCHAERLLAGLEVGVGLPASPHHPREVFLSRWRDLASQVLRDLGLGL